MIVDQVNRVRGMPRVPRMSRGCVPAFAQVSLLLALVACSPPPASSQLPPEYQDAVEATCRSAAGSRTALAACESEQAAKIQNSGGPVQLATLSEDMRAKLLTVCSEARHEDVTLFDTCLRSTAGLPAVTANLQASAAAVQASTGQASAPIASAAGPQGPRAEATEIFERVQPSNLFVENIGLDEKSGDVRTLSSGSAVAVTPNLFLTNCHVIADAKAIVVTDSARTRLQIPPDMQGGIEGSDSCWLRSERAVQQVGGVRSWRSLAVGETVYAIGAPLGLETTFTTGIISALRTEGSQIRIIQHTAPITFGNSGGGLFDNQGRLIGINTAIADPAKGGTIGFALAIDNWVDALPEVKARIPN